MGGFDARLGRKAGKHYRGASFLGELKILGAGAQWKKSPENTLNLLVTLVFKTFPAPIRGAA